MPRSRIRRKRGYTAQGAGVDKQLLPSGRWVAPTMVTLMLVGLFWLVVYYIAGNDIPLMRELGAYNLLIGMGFITLGFLVSTKWR